jgi:hypothetical protein
MKVLIDRNIEINVVTHKTVKSPRTIRWGPHDQTIDVAQRAPFPPRDDENFRREQLPYLAALCIFAKKGKLEFFTSPELRMERLRQKGRCEGYLGVNMLRDIPIKCVPSPIQRSILFGPTRSIGVTKEEQMKFFGYVKHPRFLQIRKATGEAHIDDAYHLWTAEEAKLDAFLTMDRRFWAVAIQKSKIINSAILVTIPKDLSRHLGLQPIEVEDLAAEIYPFS